MAIANPCARSSAQIRICGAIRPRIAPVDSISSSRPNLGALIEKLTRPGQRKPFPIVSPEHTRSNLGGTLCRTTTPTPRRRATSSSSRMARSPPCVLHIRAGNVGEDGMLKRSKDGRLRDARLRIRRPRWTHTQSANFGTNCILEGTTDGHAKAAEISRGTLKAILDSALGLKPDDASPQARAARTVSLKAVRWHDLHRQNRHREGHAEERRHRRELARQEHFRGGDHARQEGVAPGRAAPTVQRRKRRQLRHLLAPPASAPPIERPGWAS